MPDAPTVSVAKAARYLGVHPNTVRTWTEQGRLSCLRINSRGDRRYRLADLDAFLAEAVRAGEPRWAQRARPDERPPLRLVHDAEGDARDLARMANWTAQLQSIQQLGTRLSRLSTVREIGMAIAAELRDLIDYHNVRVYRVEGESVEPVAWRGELGAYTDEDYDQLFVRLGEGITGWVAKNGVAVNLPDAANDRRAATVPGTQDDLEESMLLAPMIFDDRVVGVIVLSKLGLRQFSDDDLRLLEIYASFAAQAMANAGARETLNAYSERLERQLLGQRELLRITESILTALDPATVVSEIADRLGALLTVDSLALFLLDADGETLRPLIARGVHADLFMSRPLPVDGSLVGWVVRHGEAQLVADQRSDPRVLHFAELGPVPGAIVATPLRGPDGIIGGLAIERLGEDGTFSEDEFELVQLFAGHVAIAMRNAELHRAVEIRAQTDELTGLGNYRTFHEDLRRSVGRGEPFGLLMLDLDDFKSYNDSLGHQAGDALLQGIASALQAAGRHADRVYRYGGDEFALILPNIDPDGGGAVAVAEKVRRAVRSVAGAGRRGGKRPVVTCSIGVATYPADGADASAMLLAADRACYVAKRSGRDRISTAVEGLALAAEFALSAPTPVDRPTSVARPTRDATIAE